MSENDNNTQHSQAVRLSIANGAELSLAYVFMNMLAATIASYGLLANSPAVIIGAMIIAMLLGPITGVSLALVDSDMKLLLRSLVTLGAGAVSVIAVALTVGVIHGDVPITNEIIARTTPNFADLMVALAGGAAGAYATVSPRLSVAFVGVAIATALVPPLSAASILFARGEIVPASGALLLTFTNIVAIQFASSVVFWFTGFRKISHAYGVSFFNFIKMNGVSICILVVLAGVLTDSMHEVLSKKIFESSSKHSLQQELESIEGNYLVSVRFEEQKGGGLIVRAVVRGPEPPSAAQVAQIEKKLPKHPKGKPQELRVRFVPTMTINRDGLLYQDPDDGYPAK
ncbi:MAG: DUF389 domain-containing protein [Desulfovibrio sp.]|nr:DUF389 domain-containing protein [Desulfovibrio sp.]MBI4961252.1 DUF389 domain-containing protein [Desulfovibrio sp.]